jgi:hypothetical protein
MIGMAAYVETKSPPSKPLPEDFDHAGTFITFFPIERCYAHAFADEGCRDVNAVIRKMYEGWAANPNCYFKGNIGIGEYYNVSKFAGMAIPFISTMAKDIPYYYKTGARQMCYMHPVVSNLGTLAETNMQMAAQLWDYTTDGNRYFSEFLAKRYRDMAGPMKRFYKTLEQAMRNCQALKHIPNFNPRDHMFQTLRLKGNPQNPVQYFRSSHLSYAPDVDNRTDAPSLLETMELLHKAQTIIDEVILECDDDAVVRKRLLVDARRFHYTHDIVRFYYHIVRLRMFENEGDNEAAEREARYLRVVGEGLRKEDVVTRDGCQDSQVLFKNGLYATYLSAPYAEIMKDYGLEAPPVEFDGVT